MLEAYQLYNTATAAVRILRIRDCGWEIMRCPAFRLIKKLCEWFVLGGIRLNSNLFHSLRVVAELTRQYRHVVAQQAIDDLVDMLCRDLFASISETDNANRDAFRSLTRGVKHHFCNSALQNITRDCG